MRQPATVLAVATFLDPIYGEPFNVVYQWPTKALLGRYNLSEIIPHIFTFINELLILFIQYVIFKKKFSFISFNI